MHRLQKSVFVAKNISFLYFGLKKINANRAVGYTVLTALLK